MARSKQQMARSKQQKSSLLLDFFLLLSITLAALKHHEFVSPDILAFILVGATLTLMAARTLGLRGYPRRIKPGILILSLVFFAASFSDGDIKVTILLALLVACLPMMLFGIYVMGAANYPHTPKLKESTLFLIMAALFLLLFSLAGREAELSQSLARWLTTIFP